MSDADEQDDFLGFEDPVVPVMSDDSESDRDSVDEERGRDGNRRLRRRSWGGGARSVTRPGSPPSCTLTAEEVEQGWSVDPSPQLPTLSRQCLG